MKGNKSIHKRLSLVFNKINICEKSFTKDAHIMKKRIFLETLKNSKKIDDIDIYISSFQKYSDKLREIITLIQDVKIDKIKQDGKSKNVGSEERESASSQ